MKFENHLFISITWDINKEINERKKLVICEIQAWTDNPPVDYSKSYDEGHFVVAIGYDDSNIYFMDPCTVGNYTYIPNKELITRWHDTNMDDSGKIIKTENLGIVLWRDSILEFKPNNITKIE